MDDGIGYMPHIKEFTTNRYRYATYLCMNVHSIMVFTADIGRKVHFCALQ